MNSGVILPESGIRTACTVYILLLSAPWAFLSLQIACIGACAGCPNVHEWCDHFISLCYWLCVWVYFLSACAFSSSDLKRPTYFLFSPAAPLRVRTLETSFVIHTCAIDVQYQTIILKAYCSILVVSSIAAFVNTVGMDINSFEWGENSPFSYTKLELSWTPSRLLRIVRRDHYWLLCGCLSRSVELSQRAWYIVAALTLSALGYEIECENDDPEKVKKVLEDFLGENGVPFSHSVKLKFAIFKLLVENV